MKIDMSLITECHQCSRLACELRIEHGTNEYTYNYDFNTGITPIPFDCPLPDARDLDKVITE